MNISYQTRQWSGRLSANWRIIIEMGGGESIPHLAGLDQLEQGRGQIHELIEV